MAASNLIFETHNYRIIVEFILLFRNILAIKSILCSISVGSDSKFIERFLARNALHTLIQIFHSTFVIHSYKKSS